MHRLIGGPLVGRIALHEHPGGLGTFARGERLYLLREDRPLPSFDLIDLSSGKIPRSDWQPVIESKDQVDKPRFSPNGKLIYFTLDRNGSRSVQAVRFDAERGRPIGESFLVYRFPQSRGLTSE